MGIAAPLVSNIGWGVLPLYWRALSSMNATSVLAYRLVATLAAMVALLVAFSVLATAIPLAMFSYGVQHSHYLTVSFIQYLNPLVVPEKLRTLDRGRPWRDSQFASTRLSPSRDMSR